MTKTLLPSVQPTMSSSSPTELPTETLTPFIGYPLRPISLGNPERTSPCLPWTAAFEPKVNGWRAVVHGPSRQMWNRHGEKLSIKVEFLTALQQLAELSTFARWEWWDVEALDRRHAIGRGTLIVLDAMDPSQNYLARRRRFRHLPAIGALPVNMQPLMRLTRFETWEVVWRAMQAANKAVGAEFFEGVVAKDVSSHYRIQTRSPDETFAGWAKMRWKF